MRIDNLVDLGTNKCLCCDLQLKSGLEVGHYRVEHHSLLKEIAQQLDDKPGEGSIAMQTPNRDKPTNLPQAPMPSGDCGSYGAGPQQRPVTCLANFAPPRRSIKQEMLPPEGGDAVVVISDRAAAPYFVKAHGEGFRVLVRDTKDLKQEDAKFLLTLLVPLTRAPATDARPRLKVDRLETGGTRVGVADTVLLTSTQLEVVRRFIGGNMDVDVAGPPQERVNPPTIPQHQPMPTEVPQAANATARRGRPPKDPNAPKRSRSAYIFFLQAYWARTAGSGLMRRQEARQAAAQEWNHLSGGDRAPFLRLADEDTARYRAEHAQYHNGR